MAETGDITNPVLAAVSALPGAMFWRQNTGTFRSMDGRRVVKVSATGIADIMGVYLGIPVAIETKTETGSLRRTQTMFRQAWTDAGGVYVVARSPEDALSELSRCVAGIAPTHKGQMQ